MAINAVALTGNIGAMPTLKVTPNGTSVLEFSIAVNESYKDAEGNWQERPNWFRCVIFGARAEALSRILDQGMKVAVSGRLHQERWEKDGRDMSSVSVTVAELELMTSRRKGA